MKKALVILADGFEEIEAFTVIDILRRADISVAAAGLSKKEIKAAHNVTVIADKILTETDINYDALILPGGMPGSSNLAEADIVKKIILSMHKNNKIIAAICAAPALVLAPLSLLNNKKATCYKNMETHFEKSTSFSSQNVVVDSNIITSRGPATAAEFAFTITELLTGKEKRSQIETGMLFK